MVVNVIKVIVCILILLGGTACSNRSHYPSHYTPEQVKSLQNFHAIQRVIASRNDNMDSKLRTYWNRKYQEMRRHADSDSWEPSSEQWKAQPASNTSVPWLSRKAQSSDDNIIIGAPGTSYHRMGNITTSSDGRTFHRVGNTIHSSDGKTFSRVGNTIHSSDGRTFHRVGNTITGSDGTVCTKVGHVTQCH